MSLGIKSSIGVSGEAGRRLPGGGGIRRALRVGVRRVAGLGAGRLVRRRRRRRRRGISGSELRGFRKVTRLLASVGMHPRGLGRARRRPFR